MGIAAVFGKVFGAIAILVAIVALMAGPQQAAKTAGSSMGTVGITIGALAGGFSDLVTGFNVAKRAADNTGISLSGDIRKSQRDAAEQRRRNAERNGR